MRPTRALVLLTLAALGCGPSADVQPDLPVRPSSLTARSFATGSASVLATAGRVWNVNPDAGTISRTDPQTGATVEFPVGGEPTRLAVLGDRLFVTLRGERALAELSVSAPEAGPARVVHVGAEPYGVVAREDGLRLYVALSQEDAVVELDGATLEPLRRFSVPGEPRYLALHPSGQTLFVGSGRGEARLSAVAIAGGGVSTVALPTTRRFTMDGEIALISRLTGDLWVGPDGESVLAPALFADNVTPIREVTPEDLEPGVPIDPVDPGVEGYGGAGDGVGKFTPAIVEVPTGPTGEPSGAPRAVFASMTAFSPDGAMQTLGSYLSSVSVSPSGDRWLATMQASSTALLLDPSASVHSGAMMFDNAPGGDSLFAPFTLPEDGGFELVAMAPIAVGAGPDGGVFDASGQAYVHSALAGAVDQLPLAVADDQVVRSGQDLFNRPELVARGSHRVVSASPLPLDVQLGRLLFFSATESSMGAGGISCSTCHFEGRNDGITWTFESGVRQTPSLAGVVSETAPVTWTSDVASVQLEADLTSRGRMGGQGLNATQLDAIAAYIDWTREVDVPLKGANDASIARGKAIFERADVACASCHRGDRLTDNQGHAIRGVQNLNTPGLRGIAATAPYLHDGSAPTLRTVLEWARGGVMGDTSSLSSAEMDDLEAYLRSL